MCIRDSVKPILNSKCISCHGGVKKNAGLSFLFRDEAIAVTQSGKPSIIPGSAKKSELIKRLHETDLEERMPYRKPKLSDKEIEILTKWIDQGAKWGTHWAYIAPEKQNIHCLLYTSDAADDSLRVDLGGRRII